MLSEILGVGTCVFQLRNVNGAWEVLPILLIKRTKSEALFFSRAALMLLECLEITEAPAQVYDL